MKRFFGIALVSVMATAAHAGSLTLDARFDYESLSKNDNSTSTPFSAFQVNRLKMDYQGAVGGTKFRAKVNLLNNTSANETTDGVGSFLDYAYASREVASGWSINMGKIITGMGGIEALNNAGDIYLRSAVGEEVATMYWQGGVQAEGKVGDGKVTINYTNNTTDHAGQTSSMAGLTYVGKSGDLTPYLSYHTEKSEISAVKRNNTYMGLGVKWASNVWEVELDYLDNKYNGDTGFVYGGDYSKQSTSIPVLVRYKMGGSSVHFKYEMSTIKLNTAGDAKVNGMTLAYESNDAKADGWRWHAAYTQEDTTPNGGSAATDKTLYVGMRVLADFLK